MESLVDFVTRLLIRAILVMRNKDGFVTSSMSHLWNKYPIRVGGIDYMSNDVLRKVLSTLSTDNDKSHTSDT